MSHAKPTALLQQRLGARVVRTDDASRFAGSFDGSKIAFDCDAVVRVRKEADVEVALALANEHCVPVTVRGGGMHGGKYGVTRDYVLSLSGYLPTGERVQWAGEFKKWSAGFNLRDLWIGSEGCLGIDPDLRELREVEHPATKPWRRRTGQRRAATAHRHRHTILVGQRQHHAHVGVLAHANHRVAVERDLAAVERTGEARGLVGADDPGAESVLQESGRFGVRHGAAELGAHPRRVQPLSGGANRASSRRPGPRRAPPASASSPAAPGCRPR